MSRYIRPMQRMRVLTTAVLSLMILSSCAAGLTLAVQPDGSGTLAVDARIPDTTAARLRSYASAPGATPPANSPLFDAAVIRREAGQRGLTSVSADTPSPNRFRGTFSFRSLESVAAAPGLSETGALRVETKEGVTSVYVRLSRDNARALPLLFPGLDPYILEALSPPALDPYPVKASEYRAMLQALLGSASLEELESAEIRLQVRSPGPIVRHGGGSVSDRTFTAVLKLMDLLTLEKPIEFSVGWK